MEDRFMELWNNLSVMAFYKVIGLLAVVASLTVSCVGLLSQAALNHKRRSTDGLAPKLVYTGIASFGLWGLYGWLRPDRYIAMSNTVGFVIVLILLFQLVKYGSAHPLKRQNPSVWRLLHSIYTPQAIFLREALVLSTTQQSIAGRFVVPSTAGYTHQQIGYVTTEQYIRCISQLAYVLIAHLIELDAPEFPSTDKPTFLRMMSEFKFFIREMNLQFAIMTKKDAEFQLVMQLVKVRRMRGYWICWMQITGAVESHKVIFMSAVDGVEEKSTS